MIVAPTLRTVVRRLSLQLGVLAGQDALDRPVRWVAVSELEDPTPFLEGGELVLTTGMRLDAGNAGPYVDRLVAQGGRRARVRRRARARRRSRPRWWTAAARAGLPLIEVPRDTPFVAIGKAVSELLAAEQYEEISRAFAAQGRLTRAALRPEGPRGGDRPAGPGARRLGAPARRGGSRTACGRQRRAATSPPRASRPELER